MRVDQFVRHIARVRGSVAQPLQLRQFCQRADQAAQAPGAAARRVAVPGVDVLAEQGDLAGTLGNQAAGFGDDSGGGTALLGAAGIGHDAEAAKPVAALLDGQEGGDALGRRGLGQLVELRLGWEIGVDHRTGLVAVGGAGSAGNHFGQAMVGLRAEHNVHEGGTRQDLLAFRLGDAAGDGQDHAAAGRGPGFLQATQAAQLGEHLLRRLFPYVAGVEDHHVGAIGRLSRGIAQRCKDVGHPGGVVHVHLATPGDHVQPLRASYGCVAVVPQGHRPSSAQPGRTTPARGAGGIVVRVGAVKRGSARESS